jgi:hypothetical protein
LNFILNAPVPLSNPFKTLERERKLLRQQAFSFRRQKRFFKQKAAPPFALKLPGRRSLN